MTPVATELIFTLGFMISALSFLIFGTYPLTKSKKISEAGHPLILLNGIVLALGFYSYCSGVRPFGTIYGNFLIGSGLLVILGLLGIILGLFLLKKTGWLVLTTFSSLFSLIFIATGLAGVIVKNELVTGPFLILFGILGIPIALDRGKIAHYSSYVIMLDASILFLLSYLGLLSLAV